MHENIISFIVNCVRDRRITFFLSYFFISCIKYYKISYFLCFKKNNAWVLNIETLTMRYLLIKCAVYEINVIVKLNIACN